MHGRVESAQKWHVYHGISQKPYNIDHNYLLWFHTLTPTTHVPSIGEI